MGNTPPTRAFIETLSKTEAYELGYRIGLDENHRQKERPTPKLVCLVAGKGKVELELSSLASATRQAVQMRASSMTIVGKDYSKPSLRSAIHNAKVALGIGLSASIDFPTANISYD